MKCDEIRELMPDLAAGVNAAAPEMNEHLRSCAECAGKLQELRQTMALLDQWQVPEPSPYFDTRLGARLREETAKQPAGWWQGIRRPALAVSLTVLMVVSVTLFRGGNAGNGTTPGTPPSVIVTGPQIPAQPGTAVGDLQALDKNDDLYSDFDVLDDLQVQQDVTANP
jgi:predicted anti-sigma-YlaC factor YlaD